VSQAQKRLKQNNQKFDKNALHNKRRCPSRLLNAGSAKRSLIGKVFKKERSMAEGTVKWFNPRKGYGFIADKEGRDIFVHYASISGEGYKTLNEGETVSFDVVEGEKGLRAENVIPKAAVAARGKKNKAAPEGKTTSESSKATENKATS
jgi:CspA family cold shock protein